MSFPLLDPALFKHIRFGGFVGKVIVGGVFFAASIAFVAYLMPSLAPYALAALLLDFFSVMGIASVFAFKHPELATLEGAEVVSYAQIATKAALPKGAETQAPIIEGTRARTPNLKTETTRFGACTFLSTSSLDWVLRLQIRKPLINCWITRAWIGHATGWPTMFSGRWGTPKKFV